MPLAAPKGLISDVIVPLPAEAVKDSSGLAFDIGSTIGKIIYRSNKEYKNGAPIKPLDSSGRHRVHFAMFPRGDVEGMVKYVKEECDLSSNAKGETIVNCSGVGGAAFRKDIEEGLNCKFEVIMESDCFCKAFIQLEKILPKDELLAPKPTRFDEQKKKIKAGFEAMLAKFAEQSETQLIEESSLKKVAEEDRPKSLVMAGSGTGIMQINKDDTFSLLEGNFVAGRFMYGLSSILTGENDFKKLEEMASKADGKTVDIWTSDLVEGQQAEGADNMYESARDMDELTFPFGKGVTVARDDARGVVDEANGVQKLLQVMKSYLGRTGEGTNKLRIVLCGFLLNLTNTHGMHLSSCNVQRPFGVQRVIPTSPDESDNVRMITLRLSLNPNASEESVQEKAIAHGALELLEEYLRDHGNDPGTAQMALLAIGSLTDSEAGRDHLSSCEVAVTVGNLLGNPDVSKDLQDNILDLLGNLAESDEVKAQLANSTVTTHLIRLIHSCEGTTDEESQTLERLTSDLIVLLLTGDTSMDTLYNDGEGVVHKEALSWLTSSSEQLQMCGALAVGNFARNDERCVSLVSRGITQKLVDLLSRGPLHTHPTLQHAVFSALRNLAIPVANKPKMLECGLIPMALRYQKTDVTTVQFKLLGLLRMVVDKQEAAATELGTNEEFVGRLMEWCQIEGHAGVKGEANRLSAWLVKSSQKSSVMRCITKCGGVPFLINMANAEHAVMQNEALVALTLIATAILDEATESFVSGDLVPVIKVILTDEETLPEIISNVFTLIKGLTPSETLMDLMKAADIPDTLKSLSKHEDASVKQGAKGIASIFDRG